jgi:DNA-binding transcriptional ArsR family regulator
MHEREGLTVQVREGNARLSAFAAFARQRSFSAAAAELRISQPAISKHIAELERALGLKLVERGGGTVRSRMPATSLRTTCFGPSPSWCKQAPPNSAKAAPRMVKIFIVGVSAPGPVGYGAGSVSARRIGVGAGRRLELLPAL